jgi:hypothetical protein
MEKSSVETEARYENYLFRGFRLYVTFEPIPKDVQLS